MKARVIHTQLNPLTTPSAGLTHDLYTGVLSPIEATLKLLQEALA